MAAAPAARDYGSLRRVTPLASTLKIGRQKLRAKTNCEVRAASMDAFVGEAVAAGPEGALRA